MLKIGGLIRLLRKSKGWTLEDLNKRVIAVGGRKKSYCVSYFSYIESGATIPSPWLTLILSKVFKYDYDKMVDLIRVQFQDNAMAKFEMRYRIGGENYNE